MEALIQLMIDECPTVKPNLNHKFLPPEAQIILRNLERLERRLLPIIHAVIMGTGVFVRISKSTFFNSNTQEFVIIKSTVTKNHKDIFKEAEKLKSQYNENINLVVCYIDCEDFTSQVDVGLANEAKILSGDHGLNYLFSVNKEKTMRLIRNELGRKYKDLIRDFTF